MNEASKINSSEIFYDAVKYMEENICERLYLKDIARHCMVSVSALEKNFSLFANCGVKRYFLDFKLEHAAAMLLNETPLNVLAKELSFSSQSHFSVAFKKKYGISPTKCRYENEKIFK